MGLFKRKEKKDEKKGVPSLPELPRLPDFPRLEDQDPNLKNSLSRLPRFPSNSLGKKFSQESIKDAVTGEKEGDGGSEIDEFEVAGKLKEPLKRSVRELPYEDMEEYDEGSMEMPEERMMRGGAEPIFIRIDKFEEGLHIFEETKRKITEIEKILGETKRVKEKEERELQDWENELRTIKNQIEKIDRDIFSKI
jgi:hypothetical protein